MKVQWSFSGLKDYINCAHQFQQVKVLKKFTKSDTAQTLYGKEVHTALEDYVRDGKPLAQNYERFKPVMDSILSIPGKRFPEQKFALDENLVPCEFDSPDYHVRGIVDLLIIDDDFGLVIDYKTGSAKYPDTKQLKLMSIFAFKHFPELKKIKGGLLFVAHNKFIPEEYNRDDLHSLWNSFRPDIVRLAESHKLNYWPKNPSGLCPWCPVKECEFWRPRR